MMRAPTLLSLMLVVCLGFGLFKVKYEVQSLEDELGRINRQINADQASIHVLKAEWSSLAQPGRVGELARRHLPLAPLTSGQLGSLATLDTLPQRATAGDAAPIGTALAQATQPTSRGKPTHVIAVKAGGMP
ncbi:MAG TPA: hypothetical protein VNT30_14870 [Stellaceae bacterium]|nr:hypothetical protein [Stellaceae bacterium]